MNKDTKKYGKKQVYKRFLDVFLFTGISVAAKNILALLFSRKISQGIQTFSFDSNTNGNRIPSYLVNILENAFLEENKPIFSKLEYSKGKTTYQFSEHSISYFEWAEQSHILKKQGKRKKAEPYDVVDIDEYLKIRSNHAKNLYIKLLAWTSTYKLWIGKKEMISLFGKRKNKDLKKDVLLPAIAKINEKTSFNIEKWNLHIRGRLEIDFTPFVRKRVAKKVVKMDRKDLKKRKSVHFLWSHFGQNIPFAVKAYDLLGYDEIHNFIIAVSHKREKQEIYNLKGYVYWALKALMRQKEKRKATIVKLIS
ncbi:MAG: hypothetical protein AAF757_27665 [Cyanobacteria bacterium P01_D01_bin.116]